MVKVQYEDFCLGTEVKAVYKPSVGAVVSFVGLVRDFASSSEVSAIELEYFPGMTEVSLAEIVQEAYERWSLQNLIIIHRVGRLQAGEQIVLVVVAAAHRKDAFDAAAFTMDFLKTRVPFWKKEWVNQEPQWVEAKESDQIMAQRW